MTSREYILVGIAAAVIVFFLLAILPRIAIRALPSTELASVADAKDRLGLLNERVKLRNEFRTTCVSFLGGLGLIASVMVAFGQFKSSQDALANSVETSRVQLGLAQQAARNQQFVDAVENLGDENFAVRVAAVEVLSDVAQHGATQAFEVNSIFRAFIQERSSWPPPPGAAYAADADTSAMPRLAVRSIEIYIALRRLGQGNFVGLPTAIESVDLRRADLRDNDYSNKYFGNAHMGSSYFNEGNFTRTVFENTDLSRSDFEGAKLCGARLLTANLSGANLQGAVADTETIWPEGFDPAGAGVRQAKRDGCTP